MEIAVASNVANGLSAGVVARVSATALDRTLARDAELVVAELADEGALLGAFERPATDRLAFRRGTGGHTVMARPGVLFVHLALARPDVLVPCDAPRLLNRYVRPILAAITKTVAPAHYFGRDFVAVDHRPVGFVGFAHDAATQRASIDAFVAVDAPYVDGARVSFKGKEPLVLAAKKSVAMNALASAVVGAFLVEASATRVDFDVEIEAAFPVLRAPPWTATADDAMGLVGAGPDADGVLRIGGEIMGSRDAIAAIDLEVPGGVLFGVRPSTFAALIAKARSDQ